MRVPGIAEHHGASESHGGHVGEASEGDTAEGEDAVVDDALPAGLLQFPGCEGGTIALLGDDDDKDEEHEEEMSADEMKAKMAELEKDIESRDNIIMEKDAEIEELRKFKAEVEEQRKAATVESIMAECKEYMSDEQYKEMREEGMACNMAEIDGWTNKVKAVSFSAVKKNIKKNNDGLFRFAAPIDNNKKSNSVWDRI